MSHRTSGHRRQGHLPPTKVAVRHVATREGIKRCTPPATLNATETLVYDVLDDELVSAKEIAGFAGIPVAECRRALATLRTLGMADAERRGNVHAWRRA